MAGLVNVTRGSEVAVERLEIASSWWSRLRGLMFREGLDSGTALLIVPCRSVHTHWMKFAIDVVALDRAGRVTAVVREVAPWRFVAPSGDVHAIVEFPAKSASVAVGDELKVTGVDPKDSRVSSPLRVLLACKGPGDAPVGARRHECASVH